MDEKRFALAMACVMLHCMALCFFLHELKDKSKLAVIKRRVRKFPAKVSP